MVTAVCGRLGGLGLAGDQQRMTSEDRDRGCTHLQRRHFSADERSELGRVGAEGLPEPGRPQPRRCGFSGELHSGIDLVARVRRGECYSYCHVTSNDRREVTHSDRRSRRLSTGQYTIVHANTAFS
jgi:hypothetical protein